MRVAVLMGGPSSEREVSLRSGQMVLKNLDPGKYEAFSVDFSDLFGRPDALEDLRRRADFVFLALHGRWGEDGTVQGLLDIMGLPYNGSGVMASAVAMNKVRAKSVYRDLGLAQARALDFRAAGDDGWRRGVSPLFTSDMAPLALWDRTAIEQWVGASLGWDLVLKGASQGSTIGLMVVGRQEDFWSALEETRRFDSEVLIEERIVGREVTAGVIGGDQPEALPLVEIKPKQGTLFDYEAKYTPGASEDTCPAELDASLTRRIQDLAVRAHQGLGCWGVSRSDFMIRDGEAYILETNTLPGLTEGSLVPMAARAAGIMLPDLFDRLIGWGVEQREKMRPAGPVNSGC